MRREGDEDNRQSTATQTCPAPTAIPLGVPPTLIVAPTSLELGSIRDTVPSALAIHTEPSPTAIPEGPAPTRTVVPTAFSFGSIRQTRSDDSSPTQTPPAPAARLPGANGSLIPASCPPELASRRSTPNAPPTQIAPGPIAIGPQQPASTSATRRLGAGSIRQTAPPIAAQT